MTEIYVETYSSYDSRFHKTTIVKQTKSIIVTMTNEKSTFQTTFTKRKNGDWLEKGDSNYRTNKLRFDTEEVERIIEDRKREREKRQRQKQLATDLMNVIQGNRCGDGAYRLDETTECNWKTALELLTKKAD